MIKWFDASCLSECFVVRSAFRRLLTRQVDNKDKLIQILVDPQPFLQELGSHGKGLSQKWLRGQVRKALEPRLQKQGIQWNDISLVLEQLSPTELQKAIDSPDEFLEELAVKILKRFPRPVVIR